MLVLRGDSGDDDEVRLKAHAAAFNPVSRSTPLTPMAIAAPKLFSPSARATTSSASMIKEHSP
ncbi:MAG: hypothetical protein WAK76_27300, partial [Trebonia sp.]